MREGMKKLVELFQCEYTIFEEGSDPKKVEKAYFEALQEGTEKGYYPAVLEVNAFVIDWVDDVLEGYYNREKVIQACNDQGKEYLQQRFRNEMEYRGEGYEESPEFIGHETAGKMFRHFDICNAAPFFDMLLLKIPVKHPWELIAWVPFPPGGWDDIPTTEEKISVCKYWYEAYGAIPAFFEQSTMEFYVPKKLNGADSMEVAKEHYAFCTDRVYQDTKTETLSELAGELQGSEVWRFWWD